MMTLKKVYTLALFALHEKRAIASRSGKSLEEIDKEIAEITETLQSMK